MKKILYIFLTFSILTVGCSKDDDSTQDTNTNTNSSLDERLYGEWYETFGSGTWTLIFFSNGKYHEINTDGPTWSSEEDGDWYVQDPLLYLSGWGDVLEYNISGNSLTLTHLTGDSIGILTKQ